MIRAVQGPPLTDSKDSQTFRTDTKDIRCSQSFVADVGHHHRGGDHCRGYCRRDDTIGGWRVMLWPFS